VFADSFCPIFVVGIYWKSGFIGFNPDFLLLWVTALMLLEKMKKNNNVKSASCGTKDRKTVGLGKKNRVSNSPKNIILCQTN